MRDVRSESRRGIKTSSPQVIDLVLIDLHLIPSENGAQQSVDTFSLDVNMMVLRAI